jgi:hypothetical protein
MGRHAHARSRAHSQNNAYASNEPGRMYLRVLGGPLGDSGVPPIMRRCRHTSHSSESNHKRFRALSLSGFSDDRHRVSAFEDSRVWHGSLFVNFSQKSSLKGASQDVEFA